MKILNSRQMKDIDRIAIEDLGIAGAVLMENAGAQVARAILDRFPCPGDERIVIVAGKGNNGGDGLVAARHLFNAGAKPTILLVAKADEVKGDARVNLAIVRRLGIPILEVPGAPEWRRAKSNLTQATVVVDALFGTGLDKPLEGFWAEVVDAINRARGFIVAVDIPSGLSSDTFETIGPCVKADLTVCLAAPKIPHIFPPAGDSTGELLMADISIPPFLFENPGLTLDLLDTESVAPFFRKRRRDSHKGDYGHVLVIAGSLGKTGAAAMAGRAALKTGAGLATIATPRSCLPAIARTMMELMTEPLEETPMKSIGVDALTTAIKLLKGKGALVLGPGLSTHAATAEFLRLLLPEIKIPAVIDADALNIIASDPDMLAEVDGMPGPVVFTPHPGEFARLAGRPIAEVLKHRLELAPAFAKEHGLYLVLKGYRTLIADPDGRVFVNPTGNPGMATGGSGDVLSGMIAAQLAQEKDVLGAILSAVYVHGLSGDLGAESLSEKYLTAGDIIKFLPRALKALENG